MKAIKLAVMALAIWMVAGPLSAEEHQVVAPFSMGSPGLDFPKGWATMDFKNVETKTLYTLVEDEGRVVVHAESRASASGLMHKISLDPHEWGNLSFSWKVKNVYKNADITTKKGDDYPARVYISFAYDPDKVSMTRRISFETAKAMYGEYPPMAVLSYIWASKAKKGEIIVSPYTRMAMMVVLESGDEKVGQWVSESRNIVEDYRNAFGGEPSAISGIAVMTDSDNTGESAEAWYGDITLSKEETP